MRIADKDFERGVERGEEGRRRRPLGITRNRFLTDCSRNEHDNLPKSVNDRVNALSISRAGKRWWDELSNLIILENFFSRDRMKFRIIYKSDRSLC